MNATPPRIAVGSRLYRLDGALRATLVVKATFTLVQRGAMTLAAPLPIQASNRFRGDDPRRSLQSASDLVPALPGAEVLFSGRAYSAAPTASRPVRLTVSRGQRTVIDKTLLVLGDRPAAGEPPQPFTTMPLTYEVAFGGPGSLDNPSGTGAAASVAGKVILPNVVYPEAVRQSIPAGFGPIAPASGARKRLLGPGGEAIVSSAVPDLQSGTASAVPLAYFHAAPEDQRTATLHGDERIALVGMVRDHEVFETDLPRARAAGVVATTGGDASHIELTLDTIAIDGEAGTATLLFRGSIPIPDEAALAGLVLRGELTVGDETHGAVSAPLPTRVPASRRPAAVGTVALDVDASSTRLLSTAEHVASAGPKPLPFDEGASKPRSSPPSAPIPGAPWGGPTSRVAPAGAHATTVLHAPSGFGPHVPASGIDAAPAPLVPHLATPQPTERAVAGASSTPREPAPAFAPFEGSPGAQFLAAMDDT